MLTSTPLTPKNPDAEVKILEIPGKTEVKPEEKEEKTTNTSKTVEEVVKDPSYSTALGDLGSGTSRLNDIIKYSEVLAKQAVENFSKLPSIETIEVPDINKREPSSIAYIAKSVAAYKASLDSQAPSNPSSTGGQINALEGSALQDILGQAIAEQESGVDYTKVNPTSGALGKYQVMPNNFLNQVPDNWGKQSIGRSDITEKEFLANPAIQDKMFKTMYFKAYNVAKNQGASIEDSIRYASASWYNNNNTDRLKDGKFVKLEGDDKPQSGGPSITAYADSIINRVKSKTNVTAQAQISVSPREVTNIREYVAKNAPPALLTFHQTYNGKSVDMDGAYGAQCVDYVRKYGDSIGKPIDPGPWHATDYTTTQEGKNIMGNHYTFKQNKEVKAGDVFTQSPKQVGNDSGHIGVALTPPDSDGWFYVTQQNGGGSAFRVSAGKVNIQALNGVWSPR
jgi:hypothetical protein